GKCISIIENGDGHLAVLIFPLYLFNIGNLQALKRVGWRSIIDVKAKLKQRNNPDSSAGRCSIRLLWQLGKKHHTVCFCRNRSIFWDLHSYLNLLLTICRYTYGVLIRRHPRGIRPFPVAWFGVNLISVMVAFPIFVTHTKIVLFI